MIDMRRKPQRFVSDFSNRASLLERAAIVFLAASIALENTSSRLIPLPASLPTIAGSGIIVVYLLFHHRTRTAARTDVAFRLFLVFVLITSVGELFRSLAFRESPTNDSLNEFLMYLKLALVFYVLNRMVSQNPHLCKLLIHSWVAVLFVLAVLAVLRIDLVSYEHSGRVGLRGENLNMAGHRWAGVAVGTAAYLMRKRGVVTWANTALIPMIGILLVAALQSGSRGASVATAMGSALFMVLGTELKVRTVMKYAIIGVVFAFGLYRAFLAVDVIRNRWSMLVEEEDYRLRERLVVGSVELIRRNPVFGYGSTYSALLGAQLNRRPIVSHNTVTQVLLTSGIIGFIPFALAIALAVKRSVQHAKSPLGSAVCAAFLCALVSCAFINWAHVKYFWLILILSLNSSVLDPRQHLSPERRHKMVGAFDPWLGRGRTVSRIMRPPPLMGRRGCIR